MFVIEYLSGFFLSSFDDFKTEYHLHSGACALFRMIGMHVIIVNKVVETLEGVLREGRSLVRLWLCLAHCVNWAGTNMSMFSVCSGYNISGRE